MSWSECPSCEDGAVPTIAPKSKEQEKVEADIIQQQEEWDQKRKMKLKQEQGWSGNIRFGSVSFGPPNPGPNGGTYDDFDARILEVRNVFNTTAKEERKRSVHVLVTMGNGNGAASFATGKASGQMTLSEK